jgi:hypothetical protein
MRRALILFSLLLLVFPATAAPSPRVLKVLPHFLDLQGRHMLSPSLYDRDAYQTYLRRHSEERSALRFDILWKARHAWSTLKLRVEMRGDVRDGAPFEKTLEQTLKPGGFRHWTSLAISGDDYKKLGELTAWRVTLWDGDDIVSEQKSFLW